MHRLLPLVLLLGCPATDTTDKDVEGDTDTDTDADTDTDTDTDVDLGACPAYSGMTAQGRSWTWAYTDDQAEEVGAATWTNTLTTLGADGSFTLDFEGDYTIEGFDSYTVETTTTGWCDTDGAWYDGSTSVATYVFNGNPNETTTTTTYDPPYLVLPSGIAVGSEWETQVTGTVETSSGAPPSDFDYTYTYEVRAADAVEVPAGTFDVVELRGSSEFGSFSSFAHVSVGGVATETSELVSYE